ncbi:MAG: hypothetical protein U0166_00365 [Acidobacteriota bacterium]
MESQAREQRRLAGEERIPPDPVGHHRVDQESVERRHHDVGRESDALRHRSRDDGDRRPGEAELEEEEPPAESVAGRWLDAGAEEEARADESADGAPEDHPEATHEEDDADDAPVDEVLEGRHGRVLALHESRLQCQKAGLHEEDEHGAHDDPDLVRDHHAFVAAMLPDTRARSNAIFVRSAASINQGPARTASSIC